MEFFYIDDDDIEQGPFSERQMTDWIRVYPKYFGEKRKIRFHYNGKEHNTTLARMRNKNGHCTPFIFAKCDRVDKEKELRKKIDEAAESTQKIGSMIDEVRKSIDKSSLEARQLMERMQRKIEAARATAEREKKEESLAVRETPTVSNTQPPVKNAANEQTTSKKNKRLLPLFDVLPNYGEKLEDERAAIKIFRDFLDDINLHEAQNKLKFPIEEKCRGCDGKAVPENTLRTWLCHITAKNHLDRFRVKGGQVTQNCLDWYSTKLEKFPKTRSKEKEKEEEVVDEGTVDLEKKKLECLGGVIMLPVHIPLLHVDPSDTTKLNPMSGRHGINSLRALVFDQTDKYSAAKNLFLPRTYCDYCKEKFEYAPKLIPHLFSNSHIDKYLAKRGSFSQHDFNFWTEICKLFPEAGKDSRNPKEVRATLTRDLGKILDISTCKDSLHYTIYGGEERRRHVVDFMKKQLVEHKRPVVMYTKSEETGTEIIEYLKEQLPETRIGWANCAEECEDLEVMVSDSTLRLSRPHAIAFLAAPLDPRQKAEYAQKMCSENVEANLIVALGFDESSELRKFSRRTIAAPPFSPSRQSPPAPSNAPTEPTVTPLVATVPPPVRPVTPPPPRPTLPTASVPPFSPLNSPSRSDSYPTVPPNHRRYDPNPPAESPKTPETGKKCAMM